MIPIVGVSLEEALLGFGDDDADAELHDKEVSLTTSQITGSQTAVFEYDPEDEDPQGTPPGPWDGYSLFTIDLSGVKEDIEELQQQVSDAEACRQQVIAILQQYDPDYSPDEGECPASKVDDLYDDWVADEEEIADLQEQLDDCHDCKDEVVAAIQQYDPNYDPAPGECPAPKIPEIVEDNKGYTYPPGVEVPDEIVFDLHTKLEDMNMPNTTVSFYAKIRIQDVQGGEYRYEYKNIEGTFRKSDYSDIYSATLFPIVKVGDTEYYLAGSNGFNLWGGSYDWRFDIDTWDRETGAFTTTMYGGYRWVSPDEWGVWRTYSPTVSSMAGYGDSTHTNKVSNV